MDRQKHQPSVLAHTIIKGKATVNEEDVNRIVADMSGSADVVADTIVEKNGFVSGTITGGNYLAYSGNAEDAIKLAELFNDDLVKIVVTSDHFDGDFTKKFKTAQTVGHVVKALERRYSRRFALYRQNELLDPECSLAQAQHTGSVVNWRAEQQ